MGKDRLSSIVQGRIFTFFGHVSRRNDASVERLVVQGSVEGTRARGRSPMRWTDQVKAAVDGLLYECTRRAAVREEWRRLVKRATEPRFDDHDHSAKSRESVATLKNGNPIAPRGANAYCGPSRIPAVQRLAMLQLSA
ncbi:hypothetical protein ACJJTC_009745 [Scirpophaga incertulas]